MIIDYFTEISSHFMYLKKDAENEENFIEKFLFTVLVDNKTYSDSNDLKLNELINNLLNFYPVLFEGIKKNKKREDFQDKMIRRDKKLKEIFQEEILNKDLFAAVDTLFKKKNLFTRNDELISEVSQLINSDLSYSDLFKYLKDDINQYTDNKKVNTNTLAKYMQDEIIMRIEKDEKKQFELCNEEVTLTKLEKEFAHEQLISDLNQGLKAYQIWDQY